MYQAANPHVPGTDEYYMQEALRLAHGGLGWASPNPVVGCVLVRDGAVIGRGFHARDGGRHAEAEALANAGDARGATCYVSLEPCSHEGRQPSCCRLLQEAGVARVVYGVEDADPRSAGKAHHVLQQAGIETNSGTLGAECYRLLDYYLHAKRSSTTFVHLKLALSLDAKMACANGASQWLSGPQSLGYAHYLRQKYDAIMVGSGTVLTDNPRLSTRADVLKNYLPLDAQPQLQSPCRVIFDPHGEVLGAKRQFALTDVDGSFPAGLPKLIFVTASPTRVQTSLVKDSEVLSVPSDADGRVNLGSFLPELWNLGVKSMVIEGGVRLAREALRQEIADRLSLVYTPKLIGRDGLDFAPELGLEDLGGCIKLRQPVSRQLDEDVLVDGYI